jgi:hypothetical protein
LKSLGEAACIVTKPQPADQLFDAACFDAVPVLRCETAIAALRLRRYWRRRLVSSLAAAHEAAEQIAGR